MKKHQILKTCPVIGLRANEHEQHMFNVVIREMRRSSNSDVIRVLLQEKYEKILQQNNTTGVNCEKQRMDK